MSSQNSRSLTAEQRSFLERAVQDGYFEVPRKITLGELSDASGISDQEGSELLRHALNTATQEFLREE